MRKTQHELVSRFQANVSIFRLGQETVRPKGLWGRGGGGSQVQHEPIQTCEKVTTDFCENFVQLFFTHNLYSHHTQISSRTIFFFFFFCYTFCTLKRMKDIYVIVSLVVPPFRKLKVVYSFVFLVFDVGTFYVMGQLNQNLYVIF